MKEFESQLKPLESLSSTLEWAEFYLSQGFSVIPLNPKDKTPAISWKVYQTRKSTMEELSGWFSSGKNNIGIVTGKISDLVVIDIDSEAGLEFAKRNGFPDTPSVQTGKGRHLYYKYPAEIEVRNFQKRDDLEGIDLRGDGGYVVAPPSLHSSGSVYEWIDGKGLGDLPLSPQFPEMILIKQNEKTPIKEFLRGVPEGRRNDSLFRTICTLKKTGLNYDECLNLAHAINGRNRPPLPEDEVERIVYGIFERYNDPQKSVFQFSDPLYTQETEKLDLRAFNYSDVLKRGRDLQKLDIKVEWIIENILPAQSITLLHGRGGIGKTWLSLQIGDAVSQGAYLWGQATKKLPVYYIDLENSYPVLVERVKKLNIEQMFFWHNSSDTPPPKIDSPAWTVYRDKLPPGLLIVDTLRAFQSLDENDSRHMAGIMANLKAIRDRGFTIILLHHTPKNNERTYKGSTAIFDLCDHVLSIHSVKQPGTEEEDDSFGKYRWFGTKDKTRYKPFNISLMFEPEEGFIEIKGPDVEDSEKIRLWITELVVSDSRLPNQSEVIDNVVNKNGLSKSRIQKLLIQGEGNFWVTIKGGDKNKKLFHPVFDFSKLLHDAETRKQGLDTADISLLKKFWIWENRNVIERKRQEGRGYEALIFRMIEGMERCITNYNLPS